MRGKLNWALCAALSLAMLALSLCAVAQDAAHPGAEALPGAAHVDLSAGAEAMPAGVKRDGETITITSGGSYRLSGALAGQLVVDADGKARVTLALDGVDISNDSGSAVFVKNTGIVTLLLPEGSANRIVSGSPAALDGTAVDDAAEGGAIHAKDDLVIEGAGALFVGGYINNGVHCSDDLTISGGDLIVEAVHNGVKGKDSVTVSGGDLKITCGGDGVVSDETGGEGRGAVTLAGGALDIVSAGDGAQAETLLDIRGGALSICAGGGSANAPAREEESPFGGGRGFGGKRGFGGGRSGFPDNSGKSPDIGRTRETPPDLPGDSDAVPDMPPELSGDSDAAPDAPPDLPGSDSGGPYGASAPESEGANAGPTANSEDADSEGAESGGAKGLKSGGALRVSGGTVRVDAAGDALHADGSVDVTGGTLTLSSGDDGMHADEALTVAGGGIEISNSYEGVEANRIFISGGKLSVKATDDGLNASGGAQVSRGRRSPDEAQIEGSQGETPGLWITGGELRVDAEGDGLDSNGDIRVDGGYVIVDGPSRGGNGAIDSGSESGGSCRVSGGTVLAIGASGMAESFDADSSQLSLQANFDAAVPAGSEVTVTAADGAELISHVAAKSFSSVVFSCPELRLGDEVTITAGDHRINLTLSEVSTGAGSGWWNR